MRKNKADTAETKRQILAQAERLFRERGPERVSVADVMEAAGMTHGGFYKHFVSKEALFVEILEQAFSDKIGLIGELVAADSRNGVSQYLKRYLTKGHVEDQAGGCPIAGLSIDARRTTSEAAAALSNGAIKIIKYVAQGSEDKDEAIRSFSLALGALILARSVQDQEIRSHILHVAAEAINLEVK